jgi:hypothetical protein
VSPRRMESPFPPTSSPSGFHLRRIMSRVDTKSGGMLLLDSRARQEYLKSLMLILVKKGMSFLFGAAPPLTEQLAARLRPAVSNGRPGIRGPN